jgi:Tol biopolymer transport system component
LKKQTSILLSLLTLATVFTAACGDSSSAPQFTQLTFLSDRTVSPATIMFASKLDGTTVTPVASTASQPYYPSISADAKTVAFYDQSDAWVQKADGTGVLNLTTTTRSNSEVNFVRISPNGKQVVFSENNDGHVHIINVDATGDLDLIPTFPTGMTDCYTAAFNASSTLVAFVCSGGANYGIYTVKPDGTAMTTVTATRTAWTDLPSFTPDGKKIVFIGENISSVLDVESINLDGSGDTVLVSNTYEAAVINSTLYYTFNDTNLKLNQVYKANLDGTHAVSISDGLHTDYLGLSQ